MHLVSATVGITSFSLNPRNCPLRLTLQRGRRDTWCDAEPSLASPLLASPHRTGRSACMQTFEPLSPQRRRIGREDL